MYGSLIASLPLLWLVSADKGVHHGGFDCAHLQTGIGETLNFSETELGQRQRISSTLHTPPTYTTMQYTINLCAPHSDQSQRREDDDADVDECPEDSLLCLSVHNSRTKPAPVAEASTSDVISVIPFARNHHDLRWSIDREGDDELVLSLAMHGDKHEYAGTKQHVKLYLYCSSHHDEAPRVLGYDYRIGSLEISWSHKAACAHEISQPLDPDRNKAAPVHDDDDADSPPSSLSSRLKSFFMTFFGWFFGILAAYFVIGAYWNHSTGLRGWDIVPHQAFWSRVPGLFADAMRQLLASAAGRYRTSGYISI